MYIKYADTALWFAEYVYLLILFKSFVVALFLKVPLDINSRSYKL